MGKAIGGCLAALASTAAILGLLVVLGIALDATALGNVFLSVRFSSSTP